MQRNWLFFFLTMLVGVPMLLRAAELSLDDLKYEQAARAAEIALLQSDGWGMVAMVYGEGDVVEHVPTRDDFELLALQLVALDIKIRLYTNLPIATAHRGHDDLVHRSVPLTAACNMIMWWQSQPDISMQDFETLCAYRRRVYALAGRSEALMAALAEDFNAFLAGVLPSTDDRIFLERFKDGLLTSAVITALGVDATYERILGIRRQVINELAELREARGRTSSDARSARSGSVVCPSPASTPVLEGFERSSVARGAAIVCEL